MDTIKKIYEGWAEEKYPDDTTKFDDSERSNKSIQFFNNRIAEKLRNAYTAALEDRLEPVAVAFAEWKDDNYIRLRGLYNPRKDGLIHVEGNGKTLNQLFLYFIKNIYGK